MTIDEFPASAAARPLWLITLADLALLLVGFFVLLQANQQLDRKVLAAGIRQGFGMPAPAAAPRAAPIPAPLPAPTPQPMPVAAAAMSGFAPGSATLPDAPDALVAWARDAARDPRVTFTVTGVTDGSAGDIDPASGSAAVLAAGRARAVAAAIGRVAGNRMLIITAARAGSRQVTVTFAFAGEGKIP